MPNAPASPPEIQKGDSVAKQPADSLTQLRDAIEQAAHLLPAQGPISVFVHHNTLHCFEGQSFAEAVLSGGQLYGCEPYLSEERYRQELRQGRIRIQDLRQVLMDDLGDGADELVASFGTRYMLRLAMLQTTLQSVPDAELRWLTAETDLLQRFHPDISRQTRQQMVRDTQQWAASYALHPAADQSPGSVMPTLPPAVTELIREIGPNHLEALAGHKREAFVLRLLWHVCRDGVLKAGGTNTPPVSSANPREVLQTEAEDVVQAEVNTVLTRFCAAFLDQGLSGWTLPDRELGFAVAFAELYRRRPVLTAAWMQGLADDLQPIAEGRFDPLTSIAESLQRLAVPEHEYQEFLSQSLLSLRGWAGMIYQLETTASAVPRPPTRGSLNEYLAIRLLLEFHARTYFGRQQSADSELRLSGRLRQRNPFKAACPSVDQQTYTVFQLAGFCGWTPRQLRNMSRQQWNCLIKEIDAFPAVQRRRVFHEAYEHRYTTSALAALASHSRKRRQGRPAVARPAAYQVVFCIDDREESLRRHLEETDPECVTASAAGFYGIAMYYRGADHAHFRPLCPNVMTPEHYVQEEPLFSATDSHVRRAERRRRLGFLTHQVHAGSRTLIGGWLTATFGAVATVPMVARILAPHLTSRIRESAGLLVRPPATELHLERTAEAPGSAPESLGYSLDEMAAIVQRILQDIGLLQNFPRIVLFLGHGSGSLNNPHESAYNCGACSGGRGGPNARAFAIMANDRCVRARINERGLTIPEDVYFLSGCHNTCSDRIDYFDLDLLPRSHRPLFRRIEDSLNQARARNAHERCRRFESAPLDLTPAAALQQVEQRAEDLSQARPEFNHATNALTVVGRRDWTRGLFLDRRAFLASYDPRVDDSDATVLSRILAAAIPVCAGISLEYYFSTVDPEGYGCGSKLPHNVTAMLGVMTGASSDLRPGLSQQMTEIHEPLRMLFVIETTPETMLAILHNNPVIGRLVTGQWVRLAVIDADTATIHQFRNDRFERYTPEQTELPAVSRSFDWYGGHRQHLGFVSIPEQLPARARSADHSSATVGGGVR